MPRHRSSAAPLAWLYVALIVYASLYPFSGWTVPGVSPFAFLARILNESCPGNNVSGRKALWARLGPDALDPTEELLNAAQDFGLRHAPSLQSSNRPTTSRSMPSRTRSCEDDKRS